MAYVNQREPGSDTSALLFTAEMYGLQLDHLADVLATGEPQARRVVTAWRARGYAQAARLGPGSSWTWLTRAGLTACGLRYSSAPPALSRLAHIRAVTAARLAIESAAGYAAAGGYWRSERRLRARMGGRVGIREHVPDGEVHWPSDAAAAWAGECWAIEAELTAKTLRRTVAIMQEVLSRTGDYGCTAGEVRVPGQPPRHARAVYLCAPAARRVVTRARDELGSLASRVEIRSLPPSAALAAPARRSPAGAARSPAAARVAGAGPAAGADVTTPAVTGRCGEGR